MDTNETLFLEQWQNTANDIRIQPIHHELYAHQQISVHLLRLDLIHPLISGNKWFKLKYNLLAALQANKKTLLSFGGAYSNHLHALAYAGNLFQFHTIGIVRGEEQLTPTIADCIHWGMSMHYMPRGSYRFRYESDFIQDIQQRYPEAFLIPEGGHNAEGLRGCSEILNNIDVTNYSHIACAVGTGATMRGLLQSLTNQTCVVGFSALKKCDQEQQYLQQAYPSLRWQLIPDMNFGGFAKQNQTLLAFQQTFHHQHQVELDYVYTAKMMYQLNQHIEQGLIPKGSKILAIHTGGVQGNRSVVV